MFWPLAPSQEGARWGGRCWCWGWWGDTLCEPAQTTSTWTSHKSHFLRVKCRRANLRPTFPASLCNRTALGNATRAILCENSEGNATPQDHDKRFCASLGSGNAHGHVTRIILCGTLQVKCRRPSKLAAQKLCEPAQSKRTWTSQKSHFLREFSRKMPRPRWRTWSITLTVRTPQPGWAHKVKDYEILRDTGWERKQEARGAASKKLNATQMIYSTMWKRKPVTVEGLGDSNLCCYWLKAPRFAKPPSVFLSAQWPRKTPQMHGALPLQRPSLEAATQPEVAARWRGSTKCQSHWAKVLSMVARRP